MKAAGKAAGLPALLLAVGLAASVSLALAGCDNGDGEEGGGNTLPTAKGVNALSGKTYFDYSEKIAFSATAEGAANGTFTIGSAVWKDGANNWELENGKYKYFPSKTGYYSWDATAKTVTISPEKIANRNNGVYGPLETKAAYRAAVQKMLDDYKKERGEAWLNEQLASMGFSSVAAYLDYAVAEDFKNVIYNYAFSADNKALFLDEPLPASKGANELTGLTFNGTRDGNDDVKDDSQTYVFTATGCTETGEGGYSQTYTYTYNSSEKMVYLKTPTEDRDARYNADNTNSGYFDSADAYNAAQVNNQYNRLEKYKYDTAKKLLQRR
ncbi:MAG: hypothetical protein LBK62_10715 [Treponema sp.]|nr:hypothetical protein [Treponema sp.]